MATSYPGAPRDFIGDTIDAARSAHRQMASVVNRLNDGKANDVYENFTLTANAASTTLTDRRLTVDSFIDFDPKTANASTEKAAGTLYVTTANRNNGSFVVTHSNSAQTDRTFNVLIRH